MDTIIEMDFAEVEQRVMALFTPTDEDCTCSPEDREGKTICKACQRVNPDREEIPF